MDLELITTETEAFLCECYRASNIENAEDLLSTYVKLNKENPSFSFVYILDDIHQAQYTSMHSIIYNELDDTKGYDLSALDSSCFEDGEHIGTLTTPEEYFIRESNFLKKYRDSTFESVFSKKLVIEDKDDLILANKDITTLFDYKTTTYILKSPVKNCYKSIIFFPNGYFSGDFSPFENYYFSKLLEETYGYSLFGQGASYLAFYRESPNDTGTNINLVNQLINLYSNGKSLQSYFLDIVNNKQLLVLRYTEC